jgi:hypothetical protein
MSGGGSGAGGNTYQRKKRAVGLLVRNSVDVIKSLSDARAQGYK